MMWLEIQMWHMEQASLIPHFTTQIQCCPGGFSVFLFFTSFDKRSLERIAIHLFVGCYENKYIKSRRCLDAVLTETILRH